MEINQINSMNYETQNRHQMVESKDLENANQAESTKTDQPQPETAHISTNGTDRVEISREAQELAQQNNSAQKDPIDTKGGSAQAQIAGVTDISTVI